MKKLTLLMAGLMLAGATTTFAGGKNCCKKNSADCKKEAKAGCSDKKHCCQKGEKSEKTAKK